MIPTITAKEPETKRTASGTGTPGRTRRHGTAEEKAEYLARFESSAMPAAAFCREFGLCEQTFYAWRQPARGQDRAKRHITPRFAEVSMGMADADSSADAVAMRIHLNRGVQVELAAGIDPAWLAQVLNGLQSLWAMFTIGGGRTKIFLSTGVTDLRRGFGLQTFIEHGLGRPPLNGDTRDGHRGCR